MLLVRPSLRPYIVAIGAVLVALLLRTLLDPLLGGNLPFYLFYFAVIVASLWGGMGPGFVALAISGFAGIYFFVFPRFSLSMADDATMFSAFRFISLGVVLALGGDWARSMRSNWRAEMQARQLVEQEARKAQEQTLSTLASIGDGLIATDMHGRITFMNPVAEQLSGWDALAAKGQPITDVFRIIHAATRTPVSDPVLRSLREENVVILPEHTLLIARNGIERAVDDSAAPIRDPQGRITGSVLVFRELAQAQREATDVFEIAGMDLFPAHGRQMPLAKAELEHLERNCRAWVARNWQPTKSTVRLVALAGYNLNIQQDGAERLASGQLAVRFSIAYES